MCFSCFGDTRRTCTIFVFCCPVLALWSAYESLYFASWHKVLLQYCFIPHIPVYDTTYAHANHVTLQQLLYFLKKKNVLAFILKSPSLALISHPCLLSVALRLHCSIPAIIQWSSFSMWLINIRIHLMTSRCMFLRASAEPIEHEKKRSDAFFFLFFSFFFLQKRDTWECIVWLRGLRGWMGELTSFPSGSSGSRLGPPMRVWWTLKWPRWFF